ncbi:MAG: thioredoxin family protein [Clostridia bacterium]|nr:thioredoxin family protein [Clostridia bacterium]
MMNSIIVVGLVPPCPRCGLLTEVLQQMARTLAVEADIRHIDVGTEEAKSLAAGFGLVAGTTHDVERKIGMRLDWQARKPITEEDRRRIAALPAELQQYADKFETVAQLDNLIRPLSDQAQAAGIMMTPALIINGELKYQGALPPITDIERWLTELR